MPGPIDPCQHHRPMTSAIGTHCLYCGAMLDSPPAQAATREGFAEAERRMHEAVTMASPYVTHAELAEALRGRDRRHRLLAEEATERSEDCCLCGDTIGPFPARQLLAAALVSHYATHVNDAP